MNVRAVCFASSTEREKGHEHAGCSHILSPLAPFHLSDLVAPVQEAFLDKVVAHVARRTLSLEMVQGTFVWACDQADWAYPYFEQALRQRARRVGVQL